jgi:antitoxin component of MazEF toxin-antitoxin module
MATVVQVKKWGSSLAVVLPNQFARQREIQVGTLLDLESVAIVKPKRKRLELSELMAKHKPSHRHGEWGLGDPFDKEIW